MGFGGDILATAPSAVAFTAPFRLLSRNGADVLENVVYELKAFTGRAADREDYDGNRNHTYLAGGVYRSRFLRALCDSSGQERPT